MSEYSREEQRKPRVAVVFGGRSSEHAISCVTAANVLQAIDRDKYDVVPVGISTSGHWVLESGDPERLSITDGKLPEVDVTALPVLFGANRELVVSEAGQVPSTLGEVDVVFPLLHGPWGEDGTIQGLLEMSDIRYVGSGVLASAVGMDKHYMKVVFQAAGLEVTPYVVIRDRDWTQDPAACREAVDALGYPVFVKPARGGSSLGISKVNSLDELDDAIAEARSHDPKVIVEASAKNPREIEVGVLGGLNGGKPEVSVCGEIAVSGGGHDFYDFETKYLPEGEEYTRPLGAGRPPRGDRRGHPREGPHRLRRDRGRGPGPRRLLPRRRRPRHHQRDQHHARLHPHQHVPPPLGSLRRRLPSPRRTPPDPRHHPPHRPPLNPPRS